MTRCFYESLGNQASRYSILNEDGTWVRFVYNPITNVFFHSVELLNKQQFNKLLMEGDIQEINPMLVIEQLSTGGEWVK